MGPLAIDNDVDSPDPRSGEPIPSDSVTQEIPVGLLHLGRPADGDTEPTDRREPEDGDDLLPMQASPEPPFATVMRGYDRRQVDEYCAWLAGLLSETERRAHRAEQAVAETARRVEQLQAELHEERERPQPIPEATPYQGLGERVDTILRLAAEEAAAIRQRAQDAADSSAAAARRSSQQQIEAAERELAQLAERRAAVVKELRAVQQALLDLGVRQDVGVESSPVD